MTESPTSEKRPGRRAAVIGGSVSGLFCALGLVRAGWDVHIYERVTSALTGRGAGIVLHPEVEQAMRAAGARFEGSLGVRVDERVALDAGGRVICRQPCPQAVTSWDSVWRLLRQAFPGERYHAGHELTAITQTADEVVAHFASGTAVAADVLIGADGVRSSVRGLMAPDAQLSYAGYVAWRGLVPQSLLPAAHRDWLLTTMAFCLPPGEHLIGYPVSAGPGAGGESVQYNLVWYRPAPAGKPLDRMLTDKSGHLHAVSIPPPLVHPEVIAEMRADARRMIAPVFQDILDAMPQPFLQPIYDLDSSQIAFGRVALIGDAAFVARPHLAGGVIKAAGDAEVLVAALAGSTDAPQALSTYAARRIPMGHLFVEKARALGACYQPGGPRDPDEARHVAKTLDETALVAFLKS